MGNASALANSDDRKFSFALLSIISAVMLIFVTIASPLLKNCSASSAEYVIINELLSISHVGFPIFLMLLGSRYLDQNKNFTLKEFFKNHVIKLIFVFALWSLLYTLTYCVIKPLILGGEITFKKIILYFIKGTSQLKYFYIVFGLFLLTPLLKAITKKESSHIVLYTIIVLLLLGCLEPVLNILKTSVNELGYVTSFLSWFGISSIAGCIALYLLGWYLTNNYLEKTPKHILYISGLISFAGVALFAQFYPEMRGYSYTYNNALMIVFAAAVFYFFIHHFKEEKVETHHVTVFLSDLSFGAFVVHVFLYSVFNYLLDGISSVYLNLFLVWICTLILSYGIAFIVYHIPIIKKTIQIK